MGDHRSVERTLPVGTVTFLFSDIEGSTRLAQDLGVERWRTVLEAQQQIWWAAFVAHDGTEISTEGDSFFAVFPSAHPERTATIAGALDAMTESSRVAIAQVDMLGLPTSADEARARLDAESFERAYRLGRAMDRAAIIAFTMAGLAEAEPGG